MLDGRRHRGEGVGSVNLNEVRKRMENQGNISFGNECRPAENKSGYLAAHLFVSVFMEGMTKEMVLT